ncbi:solute-binding protein family protein 3 [Tanacetum coccineum]
MCCQPLPPPLSPPSAKLMIMALEEYGYQSRRGIRANLPTKRQKSLLCSLLFGAVIVSFAFFIATAIIVVDHKQDYEIPFLCWLHRQTYARFDTSAHLIFNFLDLERSMVDPLQWFLKNQCSPDGSEALPKGIVVKTSDLEMRPLWGPREKRKNPKSPMSLLAMAVGKKQKANVNEMIKKFPLDDFVIMLFHYDGIVDDWKDLEWSSRAIHLSAISQTKWWFAKRFLHPDVVSEYAYIFLWDEDLGVQNFNAGRYVSIMRKEGLHISQPALDPEKSEVHHEMTTREKGSTVHRRIKRMSRSKKHCYRNSTDPPCTGWVEMMAPVFSKEAWRCVWYMIQNDLIHAWGLDMQLGYCAQGNRTQYIGIVDSEYVVHYGLPTLGGSQNKTNSESSKQPSQDAVSKESNHIDIRTEVRKQSFNELETFKRRWRKAVQEDYCWVDPYSH